MRIVSLTCSNTEIVCALGCADFLVGVDSDSDYPEAVIRDLPRVGRELNIDIEQVKALRPELVIASLTVPGHEKVIEGLKAAHLNYIAPEPVSLEDVYRDIEQIAGLIEVQEKGQEVIARMREHIRTRSVSLRSTRPSILVQWWPKPVIAPGRRSWVTDLIEAVGGTNPIGDRDVKSVPLADKEVGELNPDAFVISWCGVRPEKYRPDVIYRNETWKDLDALKNKHVYCVPEGYFGRPSPRLVYGYDALRTIVDGL